jgi:hypothetical protein
MGRAKDTSLEHPCVQFDPFLSDRIKRTGLEQRIGTLVYFRRNENERCPR